LGIGDWGLWIGPNPQSPIPNPQSPFDFYLLINLQFKFKKIKINLFYYLLNNKIYLLLNYIILYSSTTKTKK